MERGLHLNTKTQLQSTAHKLQRWQPQAKRLVRQGHTFQPIKKKNKKKKKKKLPVRFKKTSALSLLKKCCLPLSKELSVFFLDWGCWLELSWWWWWWVGRLVELVGCCFLTRDQTQAPCMEVAVFTTGEPGRSLKGHPWLLCCGTQVACPPC